MAVGRQFSSDFADSFDPPVEAAPRQYTAEWLAPDDVKSWLRINAEDDTDDDLIYRCCAAAEAYVVRCRPEWLMPGGVYTTDAETYQGAVMYAAREYRRRNSPAGIEAFGDAGTSFVARFDPDIDRMLQTGPYARPTIA
jgi:hypothetical protein